MAPAGINDRTVRSRRVDRGKLIEMGLERPVSCCRRDGLSAVWHCGVASDATGLAPIEIAPARPLNFASQFEFTLRFWNDAQQLSSGELLFTINEPFGA
jgi:hypothetical protein